MAMGLGYTLAGLAGGRLVAAFGYRPLFAVTSVLPAVGAVLFWMYFREDYPQAAAELAD